MTSVERSPNLIADLETLGRGECLALLATATIGRVGLLVDGRPEVLPVNYALDGETILFRTTEGSVLNQASLSMVAFEVDSVDPGPQSGWSVMIQGNALAIGNAIDPTSERLRRVSLITWAPDQRDAWFKITPDKITGRRLRVVPDAL